jgi:hypothetical protein
LIELTVIQRPRKLDLRLYLNTNETIKQNIHSTIHEEDSVATMDDIQERSVDNTTITHPKFGLSTKRYHHRHDQ